MAEGPSVSNVSVVVRLRTTDEQTASYALDASKSKVTAKDPTNQRDRNERLFDFDQVFDDRVGQTEIFEKVAKPLVDHVLEGYNSTCFAYGQTGSGKTYCIFGPQDDKDKRGIVPRCMEYVFKQAEAKSRGKKISFSLSFLEIYLEKIRDLGRYYMEAKGGLPASAVSSRHNSRPGSAMRPSSSHGSTTALNVNTSSRPPSATASMSARSSNLEQDYESQNLEIHQDANGTVFVKDLISVPVSSVEEVMEVVTVGVAKRRTHETAMNSVSSRSHTCFTLTVTQTDRRDNSVLIGHLHLIDLAGSERIAKSGSSGQRLQEAVMINSSLTGLGKVVVALNSGSATQHIPYRESKLTRLLQNSLGGNSYTTLLATVNPSSAHFDESINTLQFASRCRNVQNVVSVNYVSDGAGDQLAELQKLIAKLRDDNNVLKKSLLEAHSKIQMLSGQNIGVGPTAPESHTMTMGGGASGILALGQSQYDPLVAFAKMTKMDCKQAIDVLSDYVNKRTGPGSSGSFGGPGGDAGAAANSGVPNGFVFDSACMTDIDAMSDAAKVFKGEPKKFINAMIKKLELSHKKSVAMEEGREAIQNKANAQCDKMAYEVTTLKETIAEMQHQLNNQKEHEKRSLADHESNTRTEVTSMIARNAALVDEQARAAASAQQQAKTMRDKLENMQKADEDLKKAMTEERKEWIRIKEHEFNTVKEQYEFWLKKRDDETKRFVSEFATFRDAKTAELDSAMTEIRALYKYVAVVTNILQNLESGSYPLSEKSGVKAYAIPELHKAGMSLDSRRTALVQGFAKHAESYLRRQIGATMGANGLMVLAPGSSLSTRPSTALLSHSASMSHAALQQSLLYSPGPSSGLPAYTATGAVTAQPQEHLDENMSAVSMSLDELRQAVAHAQSQRRQITQEKTRILTASASVASIRERTQAELGSDDTAKYVRRLEDERAHSQANLRSEHKRYEDLRVAHAAQSRVLAKLQQQMNKGVLPARPHTAMS